MPTIFSHPAVPLALGFGLGKKLVPGRLLLAGVAVSILPDLDVIAFSFGIPYADQFGHRGFTHSLFFAAMVALIGACAHRSLHCSFGIGFWFLFLATVSHGVLDAFTNGRIGHRIFLAVVQRTLFCQVSVDRSCARRYFLFLVAGS